MSLFVLPFKFLAIKPHLQVDAGGFTLSTPLLLKIASLFSFSRSVRVDLNTSTVFIHKRKLWGFTHSRTIRFDEVLYIDTEFIPIGTSYLNMWGEGALGRDDQFEFFDISLVLKETNEKVRVARCSGEGSVETGWGGTILSGDNFVDITGDQEKVFRKLLSMFKAALGVGVGMPLPELTDLYGALKRCSSCGQPSPPSRSTCQYCGGALVDSPAEEPPDT